MHLDDTRKQNANRWYWYATDFMYNGDHYGAFFAGWISLVILARDFEAANHHNASPSESDIEPIRELLDRAKSKVIAAIRDTDLKENRTRLASRYGGQILLKTSAHQSLKGLSKVWNGPLHDSGAEITGVRHLLTEVRNRLFHGEKQYSGDGDHQTNDDRQLLENLNPILLAVVKGVFDFCDADLRRP